MAMDKTFDNIVSLIEDIGFLFVGESMNYDNHLIKRYKLNDYVLEYCHGYVSLHDKKKTIERYIILSKDFNLVYINLKKYFKC